MAYRVEYSKAALKQLKKMDRFDARLITSWIGKNLVGCEDPRACGKSLTSNRSGEWRYRVGNYRILCTIEDELLIIEVFSIGHRSAVYKRDHHEKAVEEDGQETNTCYTGGTLERRILGAHGDIAI